MKKPINRTKHNRITICIIFFSLIISIFIIFSNLHFHTLTDGNLIVHGHPFNKNDSNPSPLNTHHHSPIENFVIFSLMYVAGFIALLFLVLVFYKLLNNALHYFEKIIPSDHFLSNPSLRAPPFAQ
jgi:hypothetical protein